MHILTTTSTGLDELVEAVDLGQTPGDIVVLSFADSDLSGLAAAWEAERAALPSVRLAHLRDLRGLGRRRDLRGLVGGGRRGGRVGGAAAGGGEQPEADGGGGEDGVEQGRLIADRAEHGPVRYGSLCSRQP